MDKNRQLSKFETDTPYIWAALLDDDTNDISRNVDGSLWVCKSSGSKEPCSETLSDTQTESLIRILASANNTLINETTPVLETEWPEMDARFTAALPPIVKAPVFTIRKRNSKKFALESFFETSSPSQLKMSLLIMAVIERKNILIAGGTGAGKTVFANCLSNEISKKSPDHRIVVLEDTPELSCSSKDAISFVTSDQVDLQRLLKTALRFSPDRIIVGEVRGGEALQLLKAWNTGHPGGIATLHANDCRSALYRMQQMIDEVSQKPMQSLIADAVDVVVFLKKHSDGRRLVEEVKFVDGWDGNDYILNGGEHANH